MATNLSVDEYVSVFRNTGNRATVRNSLSEELRTQRFIQPVMLPLAGDFDQVEPELDPDSDTLRQNALDQMMIDAMTLTGSPVHPNRNTRPTSADTSSRATGRRAMFDTTTNFDYFRNLRIAEPVAPPPALEAIARNVGQVGTPRAQETRQWDDLVNIPAEDSVVFTTNTARDVTGHWISSSAVASTLTMPAPEPVMNSILEKAILEMIKNKLNLKVVTQWEGKDIAVKVSLRVTDTDEELISDEDRVQVSDFQ